MATQTTGLALIQGLIVPFLIVVLIPGALAFYVRFSSTRSRTGQPMNWLVWTNWMTLGAWLYWITALSRNSLGEILVRAGWSSYLLTFLSGVLICALPPLAAVTACLFAVAPLLGSSREEFRLTLKRRLVEQSSMMVPLSIFFVGHSLSSAGRGFAIFGAVIAYLAYRILVWFHWSLGFGEVQPIESGALFERISSLARKAGVALSRIGVVCGAGEGEANAYAGSGGALVLTESLLKSLPPRELDAVIAHELGHHGSGHMRFDIGKILFCAYVAGVEPLLGWVIAHYQLPSWLVTLPIGPVLLMMAQGRVLQRREFAADVRAVEITGDSEGTIRALATLARISRIPVEGNGFLGSIMSHPSIQDRVLAIARRFGVAETRALAILREPAGDDAVAAAGPRLVPVSRGAAPVFPMRARVLLSEQLRWLRLFATLGGVCLAMTMLQRLFEGPALLLSIPLAAMGVLALAVRIESLWIGARVRRIRRTLESRLNPPAGAGFAGLHPGRGVRYTEGFPDWDFGFFSMEGDRFCWLGEKTRFEIARQDLEGVEVASGPMAWSREHRVQVCFAGGAFTLNQRIGNPSRGDAQRLARRIGDWTGAAADDLRPVPAATPSLPNLPGVQTTRLDGAWFTCKTVLQLAVAAAAIVIVSSQAVPAAVFFAAPLAGLVRALPRALWPIHRPARVADRVQTIPSAEPLAA